MAKKSESIVQLAAQTANEISSGGGSYMSFLNTAAHNFKYNFRDQLLIYAQKPDATACAEINFWNKHGRWVNRGTTGIALLVDTDRGYRLRHVFDMSDTNSRVGRTIPLWRMKPEYEGAVMEALENSYGELADQPDFAACLLNAAKIIVEDNFADYCADLRSVKEGSLLEELDDLNTETWFRGLLESSVGFMLLARCGIDPYEYFTAEDFARVYDFNTPQTLSILGAATSDIAEMPLREIASTVLSLYREELKKNRTFADRPSTRYNNSKIKSERSVAHGTDVQDGGRLPTAQPGRAGGTEGRKIWDAAAQLPGQSPARDLRRDADGRNAEQPSEGDRPAGHGNGGADGIADGKNRRRDGGIESVRPDEVGGPDEQLPGLGGGNGDERTGVRISDPLPTEEEQQQAVQAAEDEKSSAFSVSQEDIDAVLLRHNAPGKFQIYEQFLKKESDKENSLFLKDEYGTGGYVTSSGKKLDIWYDPSGIKISTEGFAMVSPGIKLSWQKAAKRIAQLIEMDRYLSPAEKEQYPAYREQRAVINARGKIGDEFYSIISDYKDYIHQLHAQDKTVDRWYLSSCADAFTLGRKKMYARTSEGDYILPMMREALRTIIGENTHLTERCQAVLAELDGPLAALLEPTADELTPRPQPKKEYRFALGDTVYLGAQGYELLAYDEQTVRLFDPSFPIINKELSRDEFDRLLAENPLNDHLLQAVEDVLDTAEPTEQQDETPGYDLGYGHLGNGLTVWNRLEEEHGDYKTIAHISPDRTVKFYVDDLPEDIQKRIRQIAAASEMTISATQDAPVFSTPPLVREPASISADASEPSYPPHDVPYIFCEWSESVVFEDKTAYSLSEFDRLMKQADDEYTAMKSAAMDKYGTWQKWYDADDPEFSAFLSYDKVKFTVVMPDGRTFTERQDIGDGNGGVLDFLNQYAAYREIVPILRETIRKEESAAQNNFASLQEFGPVSRRFWDSYNSIKEHNPDSLVLYQVGDFFELYGGSEGEDAKSAASVLDLTMTVRNIPDIGRVPMCGFPAHKLKDCVDRLNSEGFDVIVAELEGTRHKSIKFPTQAMEKATQNTKEQDARRLDQGDDFPDIDPVAVRAALAENGIVDGQVVEPEKLAANPFIQQVMADAEQAAADVPPPYERFSVIETEKGYAVWDGIRDEIFVDGEGVQEEFSSEWQAEDYLKQIRQSEAEKEAAEWLAVERAKQGLPPQELGVETIVRYRSGDELIVISRYPNGKYYNRYGYDEAHNFANTTAGGFDTFEEAEKMLYSHRPQAEKILEPAEKTRSTEKSAEKAADEYASKDLIGQELTTEGRRYLVESIDSASGNVSLRDLTFERGTGFPINRTEKVDIVRRWLAQAEDEPPLPPSTPQRRAKVSPFVLHPEIPAADRHEYQITDDAIGTGTPGTRFNNNIRAIRLLKKLEREDRFATPEEQAVLAQYVGWGGLADCFDERHSKYAELKALLTEDEYTAARESTLTAFYTPPVVIRSIYQALTNMGFKTGNLLEPSCGIGNFIGMRPEALADSKIYGIELDSISGRIAQQLYQKSSIAVQGFEKTDLPDSFFDAAIGNVPFGSFKVPDKRYDKHHFLIHDYFFARTLDKVRPGGIVAFVTSKGTMDKENPNVRKFLAQRADLLGAIRLPNNTFKAAAGTEVTSDILFLQKRETLLWEEPAWVHLNTGENGLKMNQYFIDNPDMVLGEMREISGPYGPETACLPREGQDLGQELAAAIQNVQGSITDYVMDDPEAEGEDKSIPADPDVRNFSYTIVDGQIYYRENSRMNSVEVSVTAVNRIKGLIGIRDCVRTLIEYQTEDWPDSDIKAEQRKLNALYDAFEKKYGRINSRANSAAFGMDSSYFLLTSLEVLDDERNFVRKADMFTKRTIKQKVVVTSVDTASEALALSLAEKAKVDMAYMEDLTGKTEQEIYEDLKGVIFLNPMHSYGNETTTKYLTADEYLSGNVREKLQWAKRSAELYPEDYASNVEALERVQPTDLTASEISVRLGSTWLPTDVVEQFVFDLLDTSAYGRQKIHVHYSQYTGGWNVEGKSADRVNVKSNSTYGTGRINAYKIIEETLNLRDVRIFDYVDNGDGKRTPVLNKKETAIAQGKQELIKQAFQDWIWKDPQRRERLTKLYNEKFNSLRPREYDGSHINFVGMNPEITLRKHQVNAIAHILYGGNTLLGHVVGAGKTWEMVAAAQESKRLGLCQKSLFVVPNHLTEQWAAEYLQLYPSANILVATKKDFETKNRKRFCGRIATGDYDAIIIGHSQFEKIPMSVERQRYILEQQMDEIINGIFELKSQNGDRFSIKQLERTKKSIKGKLERLNDQSRKDDVVTFEELGVDRIFIDEAHYYKNLAAFSKMRNVGGISQTEAQKSSDLYMKCRYLDELTGGRGVVFATGTPISNTMVELYTMQKYLQYHTLQEHGLLHFDAWASTFGETVTAIELAPEGTGYRAKTRFAKFYNLPELMSMFKEVADIQTADMLNLPVPKPNYHPIALKPSELQKEMVAGLAERAEKVRNNKVDSSVDNMLLITNDGRKLALDQRLINPMLPDSDTSKINACAKNVFEIWQRTADQRSTQMVFCDLSTPGKGRPIEMAQNERGTFEMTDFQNVYDDLRDKLVAKGIPAEEIAYIHTANTEMKKKELFGKVRSGQIRVLIGSTQKMGAGTNVQTKLVALHHLDCPWRPSDLQQREGRIIRQGNENDEVDIYTYVTENTFDSYLYQLVEGKQKFIGQIMTSKSPARSAEDIDETALSYAEIKALCTGDVRIKEKMDLDIDVQRLKLLKASHLSQKYALEDDIIKYFPQAIAIAKGKIKNAQEDIAVRDANTHPNEDGFSPMEVSGVTYTEKKAAGCAILAVCKTLTDSTPVPLGQYRGFTMELSFEPIFQRYKVNLTGSHSHTVTLGTDIFGNIQRLDNLLGDFERDLTNAQSDLTTYENQLASAKVEVEKPFPQEDELKTKAARLNELNSLLNLDKAENEIVDGDRDEDEVPARDTSDRER